MTANTELIGNIDIAFVAYNARILDLLDYVIIALPRCSAEWTGHLVPMSFAIGSGPHLETLLVHILAALSATVDGIVGAFEGSEADRAIAFDGLAVLLVLPFSSLGGGATVLAIDSDRGGVVEDLAQFGS